MDYKDREKIVKSVKGVTDVVPQNTLDYESNLKKIKPDFVVHGDDWRKGAQKNIRKKVITVLKKWRGKLIEVPYSKEYSSSKISSLINQIGITPDLRRKSLKRMLMVKNCLRFLDIHNGLSGLIVENTKVEINGKIHEFDGMWGSSLTNSTAKGKPDIEAVDTSSRLVTLNEIMEVSTKPIIYDGDTGGKPEHFLYTVQNLERLGISSVVIEDKKGLKKNSLFGNDVPQEQESIEKFCEKIKVGNSIKKTDDFLIIARIESLILNKGLKDALNRGENYAQAGAGGILIHSKDESEKEVFEFVRTFKKNSNLPIVVVPTTYNHVNLEEFKELGVDVVIYANHLLRSAYPSMLSTAEAILMYGRTKEIEENLMSIKEIINFIPTH
jgi:phosphoenolpyruvate phosphomutase